MTEFLNSPAPVVKNHQNSKTGKMDQDISWGAMRIGHGKAFDLGDQKNPKAHIAVKRQYVTMDGRNILMEKVSFKSIQSKLAVLPLQTTFKAKKSAVVSKAMPLPKTPLAQAEIKPMKIASVSSADKGYVLDYVELNVDQNDFTFQSDVTYLVDGQCNFAGTLTFEGGTVIKLDWNGEIDLDYAALSIVRQPPTVPQYLHLLMMIP